ncbi:MAG: hypothetical protein AB4911_17850 [Oscillochloridaceae bacterium umkhey_bin13]
MLLTIGLVLILGLAGLFGARRGVHAGIVALGGTLLAAALLDLWADALVAWMVGRFAPTDPALPTFLLTGGLFALVVWVVGYGGEALLLPDDLDEAQLASLGSLIVGTLLGLLNAALVLGYLVRFMVAAWPTGQTATWLAAAPLATLLLSWLPWLILILVAATAVPVVVRWIRVSFYRLLARRNSVASAPSLDEADRRLSRKIDRALGRD